MQSSVRPPAVPKNVAANPRGGGSSTAKAAVNANANPAAPKANTSTPLTGSELPSGNAGSNSGAAVGARSNAKSLRALYDEGCVDARVHPNSTLQKLLPTKAGVAIGDTMDLSRNYIGDKGMGPLLLVIQKSPALRTIILSDNGLRNNSIRMLCAVAASHPSLQHIDLSDNYISEGAGFALLHLIEENRRIKVIEMGNTKIAADLRIRIKDRLAQNALD